MVHGSNDLAAKPVDPDSIPGIYQVEEERQLPQVGLLPLHVCLAEQQQQKYHCLRIYLWILPIVL